MPNILTILGFQIVTLERYVFAKQNPLSPPRTLYPAKHLRKSVVPKDEIQVQTFSYKISDPQKFKG